MLLVQSFGLEVDKYPYKYSFYRIEFALYNAVVKEIALYPVDTMAVYLEGQMRSRLSISLFSKTPQAAELDPLTKPSC